MRAVLTARQQLFDRVERLPFSTIAVIHGPCLAAGYEFALACRHRVARDDARRSSGSRGSARPHSRLGWDAAIAATRRSTASSPDDPRRLDAVGEEGREREDWSISQRSPNSSSGIEWSIEDRLAGRPVRSRSRGLPERCSIARGPDVRSYFLGPQANHLSRRVPRIARSAAAHRSRIAARWPGRVRGRANGSPGSSSRRPLAT